MILSSHTIEKFQDQNQKFPNTNQKFREIQNVFVLYNKKSNYLHVEQKILTHAQNFFFFWGGGGYFLSGNI